MRHPGRALAVLALSLESEKAGDLPEDREAGHRFTIARERLGK